MEGLEEDIVEDAARVRKEDVLLRSLLRGYEHSEGIWI